MISACSRETLGSLSLTSTAQPRPIVVTFARSGTTVPLSSIRMKGSVMTLYSCLSESSLLSYDPATLLAGIPTVSGRIGSPAGSGGPDRRGGIPPPGDIGSVRAALAAARVPRK
jgi:hypothetical protein